METCQFSKETVLSRTNCSQLGSFDSTCIVVMKFGLRGLFMMMMTMPATTMKMMTMMMRTTVVVRKIINRVLCKLRRQAKIAVVSSEYAGYNKKYVPFFRMK